jgi:hypothetical protein
MASCLLEDHNRAADTPRSATFLGTNFVFDQVLGQGSGRTAAARSRQQFSKNLHEFVEGGRDRQNFVPDSSQKRLVDQFGRSKVGLQRR